MSRNQPVHKVARSSNRSRNNSLQDTMTALIAEAHAQQQHGRAARLSAIMADEERWKRNQRQSPMLPENLQALLYEMPTLRSLDDLVLDREVRQDVREFIGEFSQAALLRSHSLEPRHTILLVGPPGTGKTSLASVLAHDLGLPFLVVRYDGLVGSFLGETAGRLQEIVDYVFRTPSVLFFDEFESVGKERADANETGEIKRVVSSLLLHMDALPTHCIVVCATNHPELLDRAVWRRFELRMELPLPAAAELREWFARTEKSFGPMGLTATEFTKLLEGESFSEVEAITLDARRKAVLSKGKMTSADAFKAAIDSWKRRRIVGGERTRGAEANRKNKSRARKKATDNGQEALLPEEDIISRAEQKAR
ncbi:AAA family ATPase [Novacetimonas hansenii]|uniref:AAA family ATPase n=1 Tax=Novacetimonas hansenii TaxID=436 RepID=UPI000789B953|nr:AAA family ATPase [Novacetimonas hansenii]RFO99750.1 ATPase [Novacetimonas hansenii]WEQ58279.1 AAA family ATPase [Novacetimonas hansenii]CUW48579.1 ATP-dependent zinc metalloprotease FtsH [Novacetimonas hansenii]